LLIHGFTGTPKEMRWMGDYLNSQGLTCLGVRLHGHATTPADMVRSRWTDWAASVEDGYHLLRGACDRVFVVGLSMGGALALLMSTQLDVAGVVGISTPYQLPRDYPLWLLRVYSRFIRYAPKSKEVPGSSWFDKKAYVDHVSYPQNPIISVAELKLLLAAMRAILPEVRKPVLLVHSKNDRYILPASMERLDSALANASDKTRLFVTESGHVVTRDAARQQVFESTLEFIRRVESQS
jgi:carboxylesterase